MKLHSIQMDRAVGVVVASAASDALGSRDEFTDDTSMALPILEALSRGVASETAARSAAEAVHEAGGPAPIPGAVPSS